ASLDRAWWTSTVEKHGASSSSAFGSMDNDIVGVAGNGVSATDSGSTLDTSTDSETISTIRSDLLPPLVQLSPGRNKYIMAKLRDPESHKIRWFVKSASPSECGGPYHADVAGDLKEWIDSVPGYESVHVEVTGGGRIDYVPEAAVSTFDGTASSVAKVRVYGFSYRYGKGDHQRAAEIIQESLGGTGDSMEVSYDLSDNLY
ncbi:MAG: hypothetical protein SGARI_003507, partial [Bacillariaceae sp.]